MYAAQGADGVLRMSCCVRKILLVADLKLATIWKCLLVARCKAFVFDPIH